MSVNNQTDKSFLQTTAWTVTFGVAIVAVLTAGVQTSRAQPAKLDKRQCHAIVFAQAVFPDLRRARIQSLRNWSKAVAVMHGRRASNWNKARRRRTRAKYDRIEQNWTVNRMAQPCGRKFVVKRKRG